MDSLKTLGPSQKTSGGLEQPIRPALAWNPKPKPAPPILEPQEPKPKPKKRGRPRKRRPPKCRRGKRNFDETTVGFLLKHEAPVEYELLVGAMTRHKPPTVDMIEMIGYASNNPLFLKPLFHRALIDYRKCGLYGTKRHYVDENTELFYLRYRKKHKIPNKMLKLR